MSDDQELAKEKGARLRAARAKKFASARAAAIANGWPTSTYAAHENGQNGFDEEWAELYGKAFGENPYFLLSGKGPSKQDPLAELEALVKGMKDPYADVFKPKTKRDVERGLARDIGVEATSLPGIIEADVRAGAGGGGLTVDHYVSDGNGNTYAAEGVKDRWHLPDQVTRELLHSTPTSLRIFEVIGDSMEPRLFERDKVFVDLRYTNPSPEGIFALWDGYGVVIKRLQIMRGSDPTKVRIISVNPQYEPYEALLDEIKIIGRYAGRFTTQ